MHEKAHSGVAACVYAGCCTLCSDGIFQIPGYDGRAVCHELGVHRSAGTQVLPVSNRRGHKAAPQKEEKGENVAETEDKTSQNHIELSQSPIEFCFMSESKPQ